MADTRVDRLCRIVEEQKGDIFWLRKEAVALREEVTVLRDCLVETGTLERTSLYAHTNWRKFSAVRKTFAFFSDDRFANLRLEDIFEFGDIALSVCLLAGVRHSRGLRVASRTLGSAVASALPIVVQRRQASVYLCGGRSGKKTLSSVESYNPQTNSWKTLPHMTQKRNSPCAGVVDGNLYVCGGRTSNEPAMNTAERFDVEVGEWEELPDMKYYRWGAMSGVAGGRLYVCGGFDPSGDALHTVECFDPAFDQWELLPAMLECKALAAACVCDGRLYICGGRDKWNRSTSVERFNPRSGLWQAVPSLLEQRSHGAATAISGKVYVCGGLDMAGHELCTVELFDVQTATWRNIQPFYHSRQLLAAASFDGCVYVFGGLSGDQNLNLVESFDPRGEGQWIALAPMLDRRTGAAAAVSSS